MFCHLLSEKIQTQRPDSHPSQAEALQRSGRSSFQPPDSPAHTQCMFVCLFLSGRHIAVTGRRVVRVFLQETCGADDVIPSESPFMSQAEMYDREDEPEFHKPKKPVIKLPKKLKAKVNPALRNV